MLYLRFEVTLVVAMVTHDPFSSRCKLIVAFFDDLVTEPLKVTNFPGATEVADCLILTFGFGAACAGAINASGSKAATKITPHLSKSFCRPMSRR